jgi:hypothetical protein
MLPTLLSVVRGATLVCSMLFATCTCLLYFTVSNMLVVEPNQYMSYMQFYHYGVPAVSCMADPLMRQLMLGVDGTVPQYLS